MAIMWHGGNRWTGRAEIRSAKKGRAEWGPGIYGTTDYFRANEYAKGGKVTQLVEFQPRMLLSEAAIGLHTLAEFVNSSAPKTKHTDILGVLRDCSERNKIGNRQVLGEGPMVHADVIVNMWVNTDLAHGKRGPALSAFLSELGIDAHCDTVTSFSGTPEHWTVIFNPDVITDHRVVPAKEVAPDIWNAPAALTDRNLTIEAFYSGNYSKEFGPSTVGMGL